MKRGLFFTFILALGIDIFPVSSYPLFAQDESILRSGPTTKDEWKVYEANCCTIKYLDDGYLKTFTHRIGGFRFTSRGLDENPARVKERVDEVMEKVQTILDMYPSDLNISIILYPEYKSLEKIFREFSLTGNVPIAFYTHKVKSIYIAVDSVTDGVLAHEMAHAVVSFYFGVPPPAKMQEILAQYVDLHLWD